MRMIMLVGLATLGGCTAMLHGGGGGTCNQSQLRAVGNGPVRFRYNGHWRCTYMNSDGSGGTELADINVRGNALTVSTRDLSEGGTSILDGQAFGDTLVWWNQTGVVVRLRGDGRHLDGVINGDSNCQNRRYVCNR